MAVALSLVAIVQRNSARAERRLALVRQLTAQAKGQMQSDPQLAVLLMRRAMEVEATPDAKFAAVTALDNSFLLKILHGPGRDILDVAYAPDGSMIATADLDGVTTLWRTSDWTSFKTLKFDARGIVSVRFSPDGLLVATANLAGVARIWDIRTGTVRTELAGHTMALTRVAFGPDGGRIATSSMDGTARLWDVATGRELERFKAADRVAGVAFGPNGQTLATAGFDGLVIIWDLSTAQQVRVLKGHTTAAQSVAFSPDGNRVASAGGDGTVRLWDVATGRAERVFTTTGNVFIVVFSPDGRFVAAAGQDPSIHVWDATATPDQQGITNPRADPVHVFRGHRALVQGLAFSPDGQSVVSVSGDRTARVWRFSDAPGSSVRVVYDGRAPSTYPIPNLSVAVSPDSSRIVVGTAYGGVRMIDADTDRVLFTVDERGDFARVTFAPDGGSFAVAHEHATSIRSTSDGSLLVSMRLPDGVFSEQLAFRPGGQAIATADVDGKVRLWETSSGALIREIAAGIGEATALAFSPDGTSVATGTSGGDIRIVETETGNLRFAVGSGKSLVDDLRFTPDGRQLLVATDDANVRAWDLARKAYVTVFRGHTAPAMQTAISPDGSTLLTGSQDHRARVFDLASGRLIRELQGHNDWVSSVAIVPATGGFVTASMDGRVASWDSCSWCDSDAELAQLLERGPCVVSPRTNAEPFWGTPTQSTTSCARRSQGHR